MSKKYQKLNLEQAGQSLDKVGTDRNFAMSYELRPSQLSEMGTVGVSRVV